jgi:hypothetical protein
VGGAVRGAGAVALAGVAAAAGTAAFGIPAGLAWATLAPRALLQVVSRGAAVVVNPETSAFITADAWFCLITAVGGVVTGVIGYRVAVRRWGAVAALGLIAGAVAAGLITLWLGSHAGLSSFHHRLAVGAPGTRFNSSLALGATSALAFWPMFTGLVIVIAEVGARSRQSRAGQTRAGQAEARPSPAQEA